MTGLYCVTSLKPGDMNNLTNSVRKEFTITPNDLISDSSIDPMARFLFVLMASKPDDWKFYHSSLQKEMQIKDPRTFRKYMDQLIGSGWVSRVRLRNGQRLDRYSYTLHSSSVQILHGAKNALITNNNCNTVELPLDDVSKEPEKEKEKIPYKAIIAYLNEKADLSFKHTTKATQTHIRARWNEGFRLEDFQKAIDAKVLEWSGTDNAKYLRPETLFGTKMEGYVQQYREVKRVDNSIETLIDCQITPEQFDKYCAYHAWVRKEYPRVFQSVKMIPASMYFDITKGGARFDRLRIHYTERQLRDKFKQSHERIETGLQHGNEYATVAGRFNDLVKTQAQ